MTPSIEHDDSFAQGLRGFGALGIFAILFILFAGNSNGVPLGGALVLAWAWRSRTPWREIGYVRPRSWLATIAIGITLGVTLKLVMKAIVMPLLGAPTINPTYHYLAGNEAALPGAIWTMIACAGFGEETVFRGFLFERIGKLFGTGRRAKALIVVLVSLLFGVSHYPDQGLAGAEQATMVGLVFGAVFATTGRIWMLMIAHAAFDLTALAIIYWDVESKVAHFIFN